ncbi:uncharacterized protein CDV56_101928 [Aspergillus thermomutatus]|uniref:Uncharacterized protein n=1 Tax=Aspergillus thermomutatus TaxID=41047 RepID=A0A397G6F9_ASPTH|nr:uncharacterized protein CDV56_101928 [Aspergillus thermomutatus]RHZ45198.1 hypothetical protein CDV56_101928 [Aspergillus thermomutatus]
MWLHASDVSTAPVHPTLPRQKAFSTLRGPLPRNNHFLLPAVTAPSRMKKSHRRFRGRRRDGSEFRNEADRIDDILEADGFQTWGLVTYRWTYASDSDWAEFMRRMNCCVRQSLTADNSPDLFDSFAPTVLQNKEAFDRASTTAIRN